MDEDISNAIKESCLSQPGDPEINGGGENMFTNGCVHFLADWHKRLKKDIRRALTPSAEEFEEELSPDEWCL